MSPAAPVVLDLRVEARNHLPDLTDLPELTDDERGIAIRTWRGRMVNEHASAQVFAGLVPQLMAAAVPPRIIAQVPKMIADELRHAEQCAGVVSALGGTPVAPMPELEPVPVHTDVAPLEGVLRNVLSVCCMSETVAVSIIRAEHAELQGGPLEAVLSGILADEIAHARFGWSLLGAIAPRLDDAAKSRMTAWLEVAFAHQIAWELPKLPLNGTFSCNLNQAGVCEGGDARELFRRTFDEIIVPGLEKAGLSARDAWESAWMARAA